VNVSSGTGSPGFPGQIPQSRKTVVCVLSPSITIHGILPIQFTCLTVFLYNLFLWATIYKLQVRYCVSLAADRWHHRLVCKSVVANRPLVRTQSAIFGPRNTC